MNILVTGGAGFIGSNFVTHILDQYEDINVVTIDKLTYAGSLENIIEVKNDSRHVFIQEDICNRNNIENIFQKYQIDNVIHFAAESHVDNSIEDPSPFIETNIMGTFNMLEVAREFWMDGVNSYKKEFEKSRFHHISTDEVYGTLGEAGYFTENSPYAPNSPYSASKASSDMLVRSYFHTYGMNVVTTNCSNNYGPKQHNEKLIPTIIRKALAYEEIPIYGDGQNVRDWLYVLDHCRAIDKVFQKGIAGETYLIGGHNEKNNLEIVNTICSILDEKFPIPSNEKKISKYKELITFVQDRPGHDFRYAINDDKFMRLVKDFQLTDFQSGLVKTINYYLE